MADNTPHSQLSSLQLGVTGDVMIGRLVNEVLATRKPAYPWGDLLEELRNTDLNLINLEAALTSCTKEVAKVFNFKSDPSHIQSLVEASVDVVNLANNHVLDYSEEGLLETLETLDAAGIQHVGAGKTLAEASQPVIVARKGISVGFLGYTDNEPSWIATKKHAGIRYIEVGDIAALQEDIRSLKQQVDVVVVSLHWGPNMRERPSTEFVDFAHQLVDLGVDVVHGHSAHIFQGVEHYKGSLILYDTGDFIDDYYVDPILRNDRSFLYIVEIDKQGFRKLRMIPSLISHFQANRAKEEEQEEIIQRMMALSKEFHTQLREEGGELHL